MCTVENEVERISNYHQVWVYVSDIDRFVDPLAWAGIGEAFRHVWTASAFKGAFGERLYAVNVQVCAYDNPRYGCGLVYMILINYFPSVTWQITWPGWM